MYIYIYIYIYILSILSLIHSSLHMDEMNFGRRCIFKISFGSFWRYT